jgi:ATP-dependent helicase/nuclease subunit B
MEDLPEDMSDISLHGVLDRIDVKEDTGQFRIIDYKFKAGKKMSSDDKNLSLSAVRGKRLQPPLYLLMAIPYLKYTAGIKDPQPERVSLYFLAPRWSVAEDGEPRSEFPGDCWHTPLGEGIAATVALLLRGIGEGLFFILPGDYCSHCDYSAVCRKNHFPSRYRAERDARVKPYYAIRKQKI